MSNEKSIEELKNEAFDYGREVRLAEDSNLERERQQIRYEWINFKNSIESYSNRLLLTEAYYRGYNENLRKE